MTVINMQAEPIEEIIFAPQESIVLVDVEQNPEEINSYIDVIKQSETTSPVAVKKVVKVEKEIHSFYEKVYTEIINENDETQYVTLIVKNGDKPVIVNVEEEAVEEEFFVPEQSSETETIDVNGNPVVQITGETSVKEMVETKISYEKVVSYSPVVKNSEVVSGKATDYGSVKEVTLVFKDKTTSQLTQSVSIYHKDTNEVDVISIQPVEEPFYEAPGEEGG